MKWTICFIFASLILVASIVLAVVFSSKKFKGNTFIKPITLFIIGVFLSGVFMLYPVNFQLIATSGSQFINFIKCLAISIYDTLGLFVINGQFERITLSLIGVEGFIGSAYPVLASIIFVIAPILTFGFILSFFKNVASYLSYFIGFNKPVYAFSELNDYSVALATDIAKNHKNAILVFTGVAGLDETYALSLQEKLKGVNAIFFKKDMATVKLNIHNKNKEIYFFIISENEDKNLNAFQLLSQKYKERDKSYLYLFSSSVQSDMLLSNCAKGKLNIRRINPARSLIYNNLYENGYQLFESALENNNGSKTISAVIVGLGNYGLTLTKTLAWFCQMDGYEIKINAFDKNPLAESIFSSECPELASEKYNGKKIDGEPYYSIKVHSNSDYKSAEFDNLLNQIDDATYVFVSIGSDQLNIDCAVKIRRLFAKKGLYPTIKAVVFDGDLKHNIENAVNFKNQPYDIQLVGDLTSTYCEKVVINPALELEALERHKKYGAEDSFWHFEYNNKSSMASAIHMQARIKCGIKGANKKEEDLTPEEAHDIEVLEHKRWNAYMRSEGYVYGPERNDLAKVHHNLVDFEALSEEDKRKDKRVGSK